MINIIKIKISLFLLLIVCCLFTKNTFASTYTPNTNLFENSYSNNLIDYASNQIDNFISQNFVIFQIDYNYYLVSSIDFTLNGNSITFVNSSVVTATRVYEGSGYNYYYSYSLSNESETIVNLSNIVISNIKANNTISSSRFNDFKFKLDLKNIGIFILGIIFAIFVTKERKF